MSADNWTKCPRCEAKAGEAHAELQRSVKKSYGKMPSEEWIRLAAKSEAPVEVTDTLREDYEIGIHGGIFMASYAARCTACDFVFSHSHEEPV